jgi:hypothetical protein
MSFPWDDSEKYNIDDKDAWVAMGTGYTFLIVVTWFFSMEVSGVLMAILVLNVFIAIVTHSIIQWIRKTFNG